MVPPVYLLLLKVRNRHRRSSHSLSVVAAKREGAPAQLRDAHKNAEQVTEMAQRFEVAIRKRTDVCGETHAEKIERINLAACMCQANKIDRALAIREDGLQGRFHAVVCEVTQERIAGAQRQKTQRDTLLRAAPGKNTVKDFVRGAVTTDGDEAPIALAISFAREIDGVARPGGSDNVDGDSPFAQTRQRRSRELRGAAATCSGIYDSQEAWQRAFHRYPKFSSISLSTEKNQALRRAKQQL